MLVEAEGLDSSFSMAVGLGASAFGVASSLSSSTVCEEASFEGFEGVDLGARARGFGVTDGGGQGQAAPRSPGRRLVAGVA